MDPPTNSIHTGVLERMQRRQEEREERSRQRQLEREEQTGLSTSATADHFLKTFQGMRADLEARVEAAEGVAADELTEYLDGLVKGVQELQDLLNDSSRHLVSFQQKKAQKELDDASACVQTAPVNKDSTGEPEKDALDKLIDRQLFGFRDETGRTLTVDPKELTGRQLNLHNLVDCTVIALGTPGAIQAISLDHCIVLVGPAARSAFIKDCRHCTFVLAGQQMRIHNTYDSDFYLHVTGAAIIEGCRKVRVAPYNLNYPELEQHYLTSGLNTKINYWDQLDDFEWLNEDEESPNWSAMPEGERRCDWLA
ncbi:hypothetical protein O3P69_014335 [Scylla paramamosain]|uniref:C-CAP/cofactor C-like domain-containing protein n=1 Tax=Scylla paramamosain TaxID=85552 RepID=A0AAW0TBJ7_SCYPA